MATLSRGWRVFVVTMSRVREGVWPAGSWIFPSPLNRITDSWENITFPLTTYVVGNCAKKQIQINNVT